MDLLWGARPQSTRGPKAALSVERITRAAIEIAHADGLAAVSMQRIAADLGFTKMSLYRHVPGKSELVALMIDTAMAGTPPLAPGTWRERLTEWAMNLWAGFDRHPWLLDATVGPRPLGPNELDWIEQAVAAIPIRDGSRRLDAVLLISGHVRNLALQSGHTTPYEEQLADILRTHGDRYPALAAAVETAATPDAALEFGLGRILDGLAPVVDACGDNHHV